MMNEERYVKCDCQQCGESVEFEASHWGEKITCPHCERRMALDPLLNPNPKPEPAQPQRSAKTKRTYIRELRKNTLYPTLRAFRNIIAGFIILTGILGFISLVMETIETDAVGRGAAFMLFFALSFGVILLGVAVREAFFAVVDIADLLANESWQKNCNL